jgi:hypothetical protein
VGINGLPTDFKVLHKARQKIEKIIDIFHRPQRGKLKKGFYQLLSGYPKLFGKS